MPASWEKNNNGKYRLFEIGSLKAHDKKPSYKRAKNKQGPVRCWFTKNAKVVFSGCSSIKIAKPFANAFLRKKATAMGTTETIGTSATDGKAIMYYDPINNESDGSIMWKNKHDYWTSPLWREYSGSLQ